MLSVGRIFAGDGWRYLWEQVAAGAEDYYLADVARGEAPGRWGGRAARPELGLEGEVNKQQMHRLFGLLAHPDQDTVLGRAPRIYRSTDERIIAARQAHDERQHDKWVARAVELAESRAPDHQVDAEWRAHNARAGEEWAEREAVIRRGGERHAVAGFDLTFSPPKSVSVLWAAADAAGRETIWQAHREGVTAALAYLEREAAWSRAGYNGIRQVDTSGWVVASFDHRMSRSGDVQIHTHSAVLNRVRCADGEWRSVDGRAIYRAAASAGALYDRVREAALERDLGVRHEQRKPDGPREIVGVDDDICRLFSSRRVEIEGRLAELVAAWRARAGGAEPSQWTVSRLSQWAALETRTRKDRTETTTGALARWDAETRAQLRRSLAEVWDRALAGTLDTVGLDQFSATGSGSDKAPSDEEVLAAAVAAVDTKKATWTRYDLARQVTNGLPLDPALDADGHLKRIDGLVDAALGERAGELGIVDLSAPAVFDTPSGLRRQGDGGSVYDEHGATRYTTDAGLAAELTVLHAARTNGGPDLEPAAVEAVITAAQLSGDQAEAVRRLATSGRPVEALVGPAGTGKTYTMRALAQAWQASGRTVIGLALSETATRVLADQAALRAVNTAKLLFEHTHRSPQDKSKQWWRQQYAIAPGSLVILDEAAMASRQVIDHLRRLCAQVGAKLILVGDHQQLDSPAAGGLFALVVDQVGAAHLDTVRRFTASWERAASLRLRDGDTTVLDDYEVRSRIDGGDETAMENAAFEAALADRARGVRTFLLADTNEQAARLAARTRDHLVADGVVDDTRTVTLADGNRAGLGDRIVTRDNDRANRSHLGQFIANRDTWQVTAVQPDRSVQVARVDPDSDQPIAGDTAQLDATYVAEQVQLDYAGTVHAAQGATRDACHAIVGARTSRHALYVAMSRGRDENRAYVVCTRPEGADRNGPTQDPLAVLAEILQRDDRPDERAALAVRADQADRARSLQTLFPIWQDMIALAGHHRYQTAVEAACGPDLANTMIASPAWPTLAARLRVLDAAGVDSPTVLARTAAGRGFDDADDIAAVLHWRLSGAENNARLVVGDTFSDLGPIGSSSELEAAIAQIAAAMDTRSRQLGHQIQAERPAWATLLGALPEQPDTQETWRRRAGIVAGYQETFALNPTGADPIGPIPPSGRPDARAWWQRAAAALDRADPPTMAQLPDEQLEAIIEQARNADRTAPSAVADQLRDATRQLRQTRAAHGLAIRNNDPALSQAADDQPGQLSHAVADLEKAHRRRQQWTAISSRLYQQADSAVIELDIRRSAQADPSSVDTSLADLRRRLSHAQARLESMQATVQHVKRVADRRTARAAQLAAELASLLATQPAPKQAHGQITTEQHAADRIDHIRHALDDTRLAIHTLRGRSRATLKAELDELVTSHPELSKPEQRSQRWNMLLNQAHNTDTNRTAILREHLNQADADAIEQTRLAQACTTERDARASTYNRLANQITRRSATNAPAADTTRPSAPTTATIATETPYLAPSTEIGPHPEPPLGPPRQNGPTLEA